MKKGFMFIFATMMFLLFTPQVMAIDELNISITNYGVKVYDKEGDEITDSSAYTDAFSYSSNTLTLNEGYYFNYIGIGDDNVTVTSNNKKVYLNMLYGVNLTVSKVKSESFISDGTKVWDTETGGDGIHKLLTHMHTEGNFTIIDSNIKLTIDESSMHQNNIHTAAAGTLTIKNSTLITKGAIGTEVNNNNIDIDNSTVSAFFLGYTAQDKVGDITVKDSDITIKESFHTDEDKTNPTFTARKLTITNSKVNNAGSLLTLSDITIKDSEKIIIGGATQTQNDLIIENSTIETGGPVITGNNATFKNTTAVLKDSIYSILQIWEELKLINSNISIKGNIITKTLDMDNSFLHVETATNSYMLEKYNYDNSTLSALAVDSINLVDSDFELVSNTSVPALAAISNIVSNKENFVLIDKNKNILEYKSVSLADYGFYSNPNNYTPQMNQRFINTYYSGTTNVYTGIYDNKASMYVATSELIEYTIKIKNGTWKDGTTTNKTITLLKGDVPTEDTFKSVGLEGYDVLKIEKTGDYEFTYTYSKLVNPKTGVRSLIILFFIAIAGIGIVLKENKNNSYFKFK